jgi:hypothetical protein
VSISLATTTSALATRAVLSISDVGIRIQVRELRVDLPSHSAGDGGRAPGIASFDLTVPGGSLAPDLAAKGLPRLRDRHSRARLVAQSRL